jgi:hypothetical protein
MISLFPSLQKHSFHFCWLCSQLFATFPHLQDTQGIFRDHGRLPTWGVLGSRIRIHRNGWRLVVSSINHIRAWLIISKSHTHHRYWHVWLLGVWCFILDMSTYVIHIRDDDPKWHFSFFRRGKGTAVKFDSNLASPSSIRDSNGSQNFTIQHAAGPFRTREAEPLGGKKLPLGGG